MNIIQVYKQFPTQDACIAYLEKVRWNGKPQCPYCKSHNTTSYKKGHRHHCNNCKTTYSVTVATIFHKTKADLQKWFLAISLILNAKKGISSRQLARDIEVNRNTAWYMGMRIRRAMFDDNDLLRGIAKMDETYIGGKPRKGGDGKTKGGPRKRGRGTKKTPVVGMMERGGRVRAQKATKLSYKKLSTLVRGNIDRDDAVLMTDQYNSYFRMQEIIDHKVVDHGKCYVDGDIHTNNIESFWALLKRGIVGQYHKVSVKHLNKYVREFCYRHNHRDDVEVFDLTIKNAMGGTQ